MVGARSLIERGLSTGFALDQSAFGMHLRGRHQREGFGWGRGQGPAVGAFGLGGEGDYWHLLA